jgi:hypothetical protein
MGLNDMFDAVVPESVENWVGGAVGGAGAVLSHVDDLARAGAWAVNPTHYDDIARGAAKAAQFVGENPGKIWDTGFEIGRYMVKDQLLDPKNLAINLALGAGSLATGGGTGGILAARMINMSRAGGAALKAARGAEGVTQSLRAARAGWQTARAVENIGDVAGAARTAGRVSRALDKADSVLGKEVQLRQKLREVTPFMNNEGSMLTRGRNALAESIAPEGSGLLRQAVGQSVGVTTARPVVPGVSGAAQNVSNMAWRARRADRYQGMADTVSEAGHVGRDIAQAESDPLKFGIRKANEHGYDPVGMATKTASKAVAKKAYKALGGGERKRTSAYTDMATGAPTTYAGYQAPPANVGGPVIPTGRQAQLSGEGYETVSTQLRPIGRSTSFYEATNRTYADQAEEEY